MSPFSHACEPRPLTHVNGPGEETLRALGLLSLGIAHDLNNLLTVIMGAASLASEKADLPELETIDLACVQGRELVNTMAGFCRQDASCTTLVDLNRMASRIFRIILHGANGKVGFLLDPAPDAVLVMCVEPALASAIINILANSLDAMPLGGMLVLRTRNEGPRKVSLTIQDTGEGMSAASLAHATEPFFTTKPVGKGTGLGLARVCETVEAHQGTLSLSSEEGRGTTVRIELPRASLEGGLDDVCGS